MLGSWFDFLSVQGFYHLHNSTVPITWSIKLQFSFGFLNWFGKTEMPHFGKYVHLLNATLSKWSVMKRYLNLIIDSFFDNIFLIHSSVCRGKPVRLLNFLHKSFPHTVWTNLNLSEVTCSIMEMFSGSCPWFSYHEGNMKFFTKTVVRSILYLQNDLLYLKLKVRNFLWSVPLFVMTESCCYIKKTSWYHINSSRILVEVFVCTDLYESQSVENHPLKAWLQI